MRPKHWKHNTANTKYFWNPFLIDINWKKVLFSYFSLYLNPKPGQVDLIFNYFLVHILIHLI